MSELVNQSKVTLQRGGLGCQWDLSLDVLTLDGCPPFHIQYCVTYVVNESPEGFQPLLLV